MSGLLARALRATSGPPAAVELAANRVSGASIEWRGARPSIAAHAVEPLPGGALVPSLTAHNAHDRKTVVAAIGAVLDRIGRPRRIGLVVPDVVAKISIIRFAQLPTRPHDLDQLVRWQVRKTTPFPTDEARLSCAPGLAYDDGTDVLVSIARREIVEEYESLCADAGATAGIVDIATFNIVNAVLAASGQAPAGPPAGADTGDWLLVNVGVDYVSMALLRGSCVIFFRNRAADSDGTLADLVHQSAMYYEDRLQGAGLGRVVLAGAAEHGIRHAGDVDQLRRMLEQRLHTPVDSVDPRGAAALTDRISAAPALLDTLAPLVGLLLRDRVAA
ncbi:MAG: pilus assembly protein PilM [Acidobacteria bacterium]|nr:pilus assembly protein PilM [Acidobacteriota bacterium]